ITRDYRKSSVGFTDGLSCTQNCSKKHQGLRTSGSFDTRDLCCQPMEQAQSLFAFAGLRWNDATARFIERSTSGGDNPRYYSIFRDPIIAATKWRSELSATEVAKYMAIADRVLPGKFSV